MLPSFLSLPQQHRFQVVYFCIQSSFFLSHFLYTEQNSSQLILSNLVPVQPFFSHIADREKEEGVFLQDKWNIVHDDITSKVNLSFGRWIKRFKIDLLAVFLFCS